MNEQQASWEQKTLENILASSIIEQRRRRRWGIFFKLAFLVLLVLFLILIWPSDNSPVAKGKMHTSLVDIRGEISDSGSATSDSIIKGLQQAFRDKMTQSIILRIDSPGGSAVQASNVYNEIRYQRKKHPNIILHAVCSDQCTSAAYYIASAADDIFANPSSIVGSIGVILDGFGFVDGMHKLGIDRRLLTSGDHKGFLDPFSPLKPDEQKQAQLLLDTVHGQFMHDVQQGRGSRLKNNPDLFSGMIWTGSQALPLGLIDGFGDAQFVARNVIKNNTIVDYTVKRNFMDQLSSRFASEIVLQFKETLRGEVS